MRTLCFLLLIVFFSSCCYAQEKSDYQWILGGAKIVPNIDGTILDFKSGILELKPVLKKIALMP
jgi:hypothetical protein